jgi:hypothetical protein
MTGSLSQIDPTPLHESWPTKSVVRGRSFRFYSSSKLQNIPELQIWYRQSRAARGVPRRATRGPDGPGRHMLAPAGAGRYNVGTYGPDRGPTVGTQSVHRSTDSNNWLPPSESFRLSGRFWSRLLQRQSVGA